MIIFSFIFKVLKIINMEGLINIWDILYYVNDREDYMDIHKFILDKRSVEKETKKETKDLGWDYTDVLYSFLGIYVLGLYVFDKKNNSDQFVLKGTDIKLRKKCKNLLYSKKIIYEQKYYKTSFAKELNNLPVFQEFLDLYYDIGNVIPIWPGGNSARGKAKCYDLAHIYFSKKKVLVWFDNLKKHYNNAYMDDIVNNGFEKNMELFLDNLTVEKYEEFLIYICKTIRKRSDLIKNNLFLDL